MPVISKSATHHLRVYSPQAGDDTVLVRSPGSPALPDNVDSSLAVETPNTTTHIVRTPDNPTSPDNDSSDQNANPLGGTPAELAKASQVVRDWIQVFSKKSPGELREGPSPTDSTYLNQSQTKVLKPLSVPTVKAVLSTAMINPTLNYPCVKTILDIQKASSGTTNFGKKCTYISKNILGPLVKVASSMHGISNQPCPDQNQQNKKWTVKEINKMGDLIYDMRNVKKHQVKGKDFLSHVFNTAQKEGYFPDRLAADHDTENPRIPKR